MVSGIILSKIVSSGKQQPLWVHRTLWAANHSCLSTEDGVRWSRWGIDRLLITFYLQWWSSWEHFLMYEEKQVIAALLRYGGGFRNNLYACRWSCQLSQRRIQRKSTDYWAIRWREVPYPRWLMWWLNITTGEKQPSKRTRFWGVCAHAALKRTCDVQFVCHWFKALTFLQISCRGLWRGDIMVLGSAAPRCACRTAELSLSFSRSVRSFAPIA